MIAIPLTKGLVAIVDEIDFERFGHLKWSSCGKGYAGRGCPIRKKTIYLHNEIMEVEATGIVDHINRDKLDNRRENLRITTRGSNRQNSFMCNNTSGYKGVDWNADHRKWRARLNRTTLGYFKSPEEAAHIYNQRAFEFYGRHAYLNKLPPGFAPPL